MQCVILAGGLGTRMRNVSADLPKSLLAIDGKPFIHYQLSGLKRCGITDVILCIGYLGRAIRQAVGDGSAWGVQVRYVDEGTELRGTGGALRLAGDQGVLEPVFFMMYGDSLLPIDFRAIGSYFESRSEPALMTVMRNAGRWDSSNACFDGDRVTRYDKSTPNAPGMAYIDYGLSLLRRDALMARLPAGGLPAGRQVRQDIADYFKALSHAGELAGYEIRQRFYEIGSPAGLNDLKTFVTSEWQNFLEKGPSQ